MPTPTRVTPVSHLLSEPASLDVAEIGGPPGPSSADGLARLAAPLLSAPAAIFFDVRDTAPIVHWCNTSGVREDVSDDVLRTLCGSVIESGRPLAVPDIAQDARFRPEWARFDPGFVAFAGVLVQSSARQVFGVLGVLDLRERTWREADVEVLAGVASAMAAIHERDQLAAENQRLVMALAYSDTRHQRLVSSCPLAIYGLDYEGRVVEINQAAADILGRPIPELMGASFLDFVAAEDLDFARTGFEGTLSGRDAPADVELRVVRPTGERRLVQITRAPIEKHDRIVGVQGIGRDVTEERSREAQFRRVERMASVAPLLSGVCHELNNPLTSIKSFAELLLLDDRPADDREAIEIVAREAQRAATIVSDLRVVARQSQEAAASCGLVDLNQVVQQVLDTRRSSLNGVQLRLDLAADLPSAWAVRTQVEQVVTHLLTNAIHASLSGTEPGEIVVSTYRGDLGVALQVADTGPGIRPEDVNRIFDPFWTTKSPGEGTGLGLSLVHSIVSDHGGRIRVDSKPGCGATFSVHLPAASEAPAGADTGATSVPARRSLRVLIVDDEAPIRTSLSRYLERRGHSVAAAAEGGAALHLLGESTNGAQFDIIVADLRMPGLDGERFVARLRERGDGLEHRLVFITGDAESPDVESFLREVGAPVVWKPFELAEVAQIIEAQAGMTMA